MQKSKTAALLICVVFLSVICFFAVVKSQAATDWAVKITATKSSTQPYIADCIFGVNTGATNSFDLAYDQIAPPLPVAGVYAYFAYPNDPVLLYRKLSTSIISIQDSRSWNYKIQNIGADGTMTLKWNESDITTIPSGFDVYLVDSTGTTNLRNMRSTTSYTYSAEPDTTTTFTIKIVFNSTPTPSPTDTPSSNPTPTPSANPTAKPSSNTTPSNSSVTPSSTPQIPEFPLNTAVLIIAAFTGIMITIKKTRKLQG